MVSWHATLNLVFTHTHDMQHWPPVILQSLKPEDVVIVVATYSTAIYVSGKVTVSGIWFRGIGDELHKLCKGQVFLCGVKPPQHTFVHILIWSGLTTLPVDDIVTTLSKGFRTTMKVV